MANPTPQLLPLIYTTGIFKLQGKLEHLLSEDTEYTCVAIRTIEELELNGEDVYQVYYKGINLTLEDFKKDKSLNASIITLRNSLGKLIHFPNTYLKSYPSGSGVPYSVLGLAFDIGALPLDYDLSSLETKIKEIIHDDLGVKARSKVLTFSHTEIISHDSHERITKARQLNIKQSPNPNQRIKQLEKEVTQLKTSLQLAEKYIVDNKERMLAVPMIVLVNGFKRPNP